MTLWAMEGFSGEMKNKAIAQSMIWFFTMASCERVSYCPIFQNVVISIFVNSNVLISSHIFEIQLVHVYVGKIGTQM